MDRMRFLTCIFLTGLLCPAVEGLGVNWGTISSHPLPPEIVVQMLKDNGINKVKLFDSDEDVLSALAGTDIEVMVAVPNTMLEEMTSYDKAKHWVKKSVTRYNFKGGVNIKSVAVGNEPFLKAYNGSYSYVTLPALQNIQRALDEAGLGKTIKATVPFNADVYDSPSGNILPSSGRFRPDIYSQMKDIVKLLVENDAPFMVNVYPFLSLYVDENFPLDFAFFDGASKPIIDNGIQYNNVFDANLDTLVSALKKVGHGDMPILIGEAGWPTDGNKFATIANAHKFYSGLMKKLTSKQGTPLRPGHLEVYLFGLLDEDSKTVLPGNFERHWGIFTYDGQPKFPLNLGPGHSQSLVRAKNVEYLPRRWCTLDPHAKDLSKLQDSVNYACSNADCTSLGNGSSCNGLDANGKASYAFNVFYQSQSQAKESCDFDGLAMVTTQNISQNGCKFILQVVALSGAQALAPALFASVLAILLLQLLFL